MLALLFAADWYFPKSAAETTATDIDRSTIRIHSNHSWPAAIRFDTNMPMPHVPPATMAEATIPAPAISPAPKPVQQAYATAPPPAAKAPVKLRRHVRSVSRLASRDTRRRVASTQFNWFPTW